MDHHVQTDVLSSDERSHTHNFTVDGIPEELLAAGHHGAGQAERGRRLVEELERPVVDADGVHLQEQLRAGRGRAQDLSHRDDHSLVSGLRTTFSRVTSSEHPSRKLGQTCSLPHGFCSG